LRANKLKVHDAAKGLLATCAWRISFGVDALNPSDPKLLEFLKRREFFLSHGRDREVRSAYLSYLMIQLHGFFFFFFLFSFFLR
jgi:hypothetical protein